MLGLKCLFHKSWTENTLRKTQTCNAVAIALRIQLSVFCLSRRSEPLQLFGLENHIPWLLNAKVYDRFISRATGGRRVQSKHDTVHSALWEQYEDIVLHCIQCIVQQHYLNYRLTLFLPMTSSFYQWSKPTLVSQPEKRQLKRWQDYIEFVLSQGKMYVNVKFDIKLIKHSLNVIYLCMYT